MTHLKISMKAGKYRFKKKKCCPASHKILSLLRNPKTAQTTARPWIRHWFRRIHPTSCRSKVNVNTILLGTSSLLQPFPSRRNCPTKLCRSDRLRAGRSRSVAAKTTSHFLRTGRRDPLWGPPCMPHAIFKNNYNYLPLSLSLSLSFSLILHATARMSDYSI